MVQQTFFMDLLSDWLGHEKIFVYAFTVLNLFRGQDWLLSTPPRNARHQY